MARSEELKRETEEALLCFVKKLKKVIPSLTRRIKEIAESKTEDSPSATRALRNYTDLVKNLPKLYEICSGKDIRVKVEDDRGKEPEQIKEDIANILNRYSGAGYARIGKDAPEIKNGKPE